MVLKAFFFYSGVAETAQLLFHVQLLLRQPRVRFEGEPVCAVLSRAVRCGTLVDGEGERNRNKSSIDCLRVPCTTPRVDCSLPIALDPPPLLETIPLSTAAMSTATASTAPLFAPSLISPDVLAALPEGYSCRPLQRADYHTGFLDVLRVLTTVGDISEEKWDERFEWMAKRGDEYFLLVIVDGEGKVVGTGALVVERKL